MSYIKKFVTIVGIGLGVGIAIAVIFALQWLTDHLYTILWIVAFVLCGAWFVASVLSSLQTRLFDFHGKENNDQRPNDTYQG